MDLTPMIVGGEWRPAATGQTEMVTSPYDESVVGTVPVASKDDVEAALTAAEAGAARWRRTPAHARMAILLRAAELARRDTLKSHLRRAHARHVEIATGDDWLRALGRSLR